MVQSGNRSVTQEARKIARVRMMQHLLSLLDGSGIDHLEGWLQERQVLNDGQEDPGSVMTDGLDVELAVTSEYRALLEALLEAQRR